MNKYFKVFKKLFLFSILLLIAFYLFLINSYKFIYIEEQVNSFINEINNSPSLPNEFYELYNKEYNNTLETGILKYTAKSIFKFQPEQPISIWISNSISLNKKNFNIFNNKIINPKISLALKIERETNSNKQLNFLMNNQDFGYNQIGIKKASIFFFKKDLNQLNIKELATLAIMSENPTLYNPIKRPEIINKKVSLLLNR